MRVGSASSRIGSFARVLAGVAVLASISCTATGQGKASKPAWKVFKTEHALPVPEDPIRSGSMELRVTKAFLEENATVFKTSHWVARMRGVIVSSEALPIDALTNAFTLIGRSGKEYRGHVSPRGPGRQTWQHQQHTGQPTHLPANVAGELEIFAQVGDEHTHDDVVAFTFQGVQVPLAR